MLRSFLFVAGASALTGMCFVACADTACHDVLCRAPDDAAASTDGPSSEGSGDGGGIDAPAGCDLSADAKDAPKCVDDAVGVFVDGATGSDTNEGTKASPLKSVTAALGKVGNKPRVYVCEGTYAEAVKLTRGVSVYGGFACGTWSYTGVKALVVPSAKGYALHIEKVTAAVVIADVAFTALAASDPGESSVAVFASESSNVTLRRVRASAGKGQSAATAGEAPSNLFSATLSDLDGTSAAATTGGPQKVCACKSYGSSTGGKGGNGGNPAQNGDPGASTPAPSAMGGRNGAGGAGYPNGGAFACESGKPGADGSVRAGGKGAETLGTVDTKGWSPSAGAVGEAGNPGGGAGGGGGGDVNGSGGGGCGGCGGAGGLAGPGGGASIGVLSFTSTLHLDAVTITVSDAGSGASGGKGGGGGGGAVGACGGGRGGNGAGGSGGGGGAGGVSTGVVRKGGSLDGAPTVTKGTKGAPGGVGDVGTGGTNVLSTAPNGSPGLLGKDGVAQDVLVVD